MTKKKDSPRTRQPLARKSSKVSLTYYRSASGQGKGDSPFTKRQNKGRVRKLLFGALDISVLIMLGAFFTYSLIVKPQAEVSATSYVYHSADTYKRAVDKELGAFSNRNKITLNEGSITNKLKADFPEISRARLELPVVSQVPTIHLEIAKPLFVLKNTSGSYIVSSQGMVVGEGKYFKHIKQLPVIEDQSDFSIQKGRPALSTSSASFIEAIWKQSKKAGVPVSSIVLPPLPMELNLRTSDKPYFVKFYLGGDPQVQVGQFLAARSQFQKDNISPQQYLDVRVQGRIFYK